MDLSFCSILRKFTKAEKPLKVSDLFYALRMNTIHTWTQPMSGFPQNNLWLNHSYELHFFTDISNFQNRCHCYRCVSFKKKLRKGQGSSPNRVSFPFDQTEDQSLRSDESWENVTKVREESHLFWLLGSSPTCRMNHSKRETLTTKIQSKII